MYKVGRGDPGLLSTWRISSSRLHQPQQIAKAHKNLEGEDACTTTVHYLNGNEGS